MLNHANHEVSSHVRVIEGAREDVLCVPQHTEGSGALVYWSLSGSVDHQRMTKDWQEAGLDPAECPPQTTPAMALRLAVHAVVGGTLLVRRFDGAWIIGADGVVEGGKEWGAREVCRMWLTSGGTRVAYEGNEELAKSVTARFEENQAALAPVVFSTWLPDYVRYRCGGIAMRESGGFYYLPPTGLAKFQMARHVIESVSKHKVTMIQVLRTEEAVTAILASLTADTKSALDSLLEDATTPRKAKNRKELVLALRARLEQYEEFLGTKHDEIEAELARAERLLTLKAMAERADS